MMRARGILLLFERMTVSMGKRTPENRRKRKTRKKLSNSSKAIIKFLSGTSFTAGATIYLEGSTATSATIAAVSHTGGASIVSINRGVYFVNGFFVLCLAQTLVLEKYSNTPTYRIGLQITESLTSSTDDSSLLDNATGSSNENAPGANRLKIELTFVKKAIGGTQDIDNFIELSRVEAGIITKQTAITAYNTLEKTKNV